jgi:hypothetical protein
MNIILIQCNCNRTSMAYNENIIILRKFMDTVK